MKTLLAIRWLTAIMVTPLLTLIALGAVEIAWRAVGVSIQFTSADLPFFIVLDGLLTLCVVGGAPFCGDLPNMSRSNLFGLFVTAAAFWSLLIGLAWNHGHGRPETSMNVFIVLALGYPVGIVTAGLVGLAIKPFIPKFSKMGWTSPDDSFGSDEFYS